MRDPPSPRPPRSQAMRIPFPPSASPHARHPRATAYSQGSTSPGESPRSGSSRGSSDLIFPMDPPLPPERRERHQSYTGGYDQRRSPPTPALPQALPSLSVRCTLCERQFTPRSDYAARIRMCDECRAPTRRSTRGEVVADARRVPTQRRHRNYAPPFQFFPQGTLAPPVVTRTRHHEQYYTAAPTPLARPAPVAQPSRNPGSGVTVIGRGFPAARPGLRDDVLFEGLNPALLPDVPYYVGSMPPTSTMHRPAPRRR